jgi:hypothetical protein
LTPAKVFKTLFVQQKTLFVQQKTLFVQQKTLFVFDTSKGV